MNGRKPLGYCVACLIIALAHDAHAQPASDFAELSLHAASGDTLVVSRHDGSRATGDLIDVDADTLRLDVDGQTVTIGAADIREVGVTSDSLANGALVGLATGAAFGLLTSAAFTESSGDGLVDAATAGPAALIAMTAGAGAGVGIGIGVDALVRRYRVLYSAPVRVTPTVFPGRGYGVAFRVAW